MIKECNNIKTFDLKYNEVNNGSEYTIITCDENIKEPKKCILRIVKEEVKPECKATLYTEGNYWGCCSYFPDLNNAIIVKYNGTNCPSDKTLKFNTDFKISNSDIVKLWLFGQNNTTNRRNIDIAIEIISDIEGITKGKHNVTLWQEEGVCNAIPINFSTSWDDFKQTKKTTLRWNCKEPLKFNVKVKCKIWVLGKDSINGYNSTYETINLQQGNNKGSIITNNNFAKIEPFAIENAENNEYSIGKIDDLTCPLVEVINFGKSTDLHGSTTDTIKVDLSQPKININQELFDIDGGLLYFIQIKNKSSDYNSFQKEGIELTNINNYGNYVQTDRDGYILFTKKPSTETGNKPYGTVSVYAINVYPQINFNINYGI